MDEVLKNPLVRGGGYLSGFLIGLAAGTIQKFVETEHTSDNKKHYRNALLAATSATVALPVFLHTSTSTGEGNAASDFILGFATSYGFIRTYDETGQWADDLLNT